MAKRDRLQDALDALAKVRGEADPVIVRAKLSDAIRGKSNLLVATAVKIAAEKKLEGLTGLIHDAYARFVGDAATVDPGCTAKTEIVRYLIDQNERCEEIYLHGVQHKQMESGWPRAVDTAAELRGLAAMGLVCMGSRKAMRAVAELLFDDEKATRLIAVKCAVTANTGESALLLRAKCLSGDAEPEILADALTGVASVEGAEGLAFVAKFLNHKDEFISESAALAIGECKCPEAFELLQQAYHDIATHRIRGAILLAMAISRNPAAVDFLMEAIVSGPLPLASDAVRAGALFRGDEVLFKRLAGAVESRRNSALLAEWASATRSRP